MLRQSEEQWAAHKVRTWHLQASDAGEFSVTQLRSAAGQGKAPLVFLPGMFSNRHFWVSKKGVGMAAYLADKGHDCWLVERRGIGQASRPGQYRAGLIETVQHDLPLVQQLVAAHATRPAFWLGHSFGGVAISLATANHLDQDHVGGLVLFASQFEVGKSSLRWPGRLFIHAASRMAGHFPARRLGLGPENEPTAAMDDACHWTTQGQKNRRLQTQLAAVRCPVLAVVGGADKVDPPEGCERLLTHMSSKDVTYCRADKSRGFKEDYNHPGIVVSKAARDEVWPLVHDWLAARCASTTGL